MKYSTKLLGKDQQYVYGQENMLKEQEQILGKTFFFFFRQNFFERMNNTYEVNI